MGLVTVVLLSTLIAIGVISLAAYGIYFLAKGPKERPGHCRECGYNLRGNFNRTCPECGLRFSRDQET